MRGFLKPIRMRGPFEQGSGWSPLSLNPYFAMLPGVGSFRAYTAAAEIAVDGDAVQQIVANTGQICDATAAPNRPVWQGAGWLDFGSSKWLQHSAGFGLSGNPAWTVIANIRRPASLTTSAVWFGFGANDGAAGLHYRAGAHEFIGVGVKIAAGNYSAANTSVSGVGGDWITISAVHAAGTSIGATRVWVNGTEHAVGANASTPNLSSSSPATLQTLEARYGKGGLQHLVVLANEASDSVRRHCESWMMSRRPT